MPDKWDQYAETSGGGDKWAKYASDEPDTRGIGKLPGGASPSIEKPSALPNGAVAGEDVTPKPFNLERSIGEGTFPGPAMVANGVRDLFTRALPAAANGDPVRAAHEGISAAGRASMPMIAPALISSPISVAAGMAGSYAGSKVGRFAADVAGASPGVRDLSEDIGGIAGGGMSSPKIRAFSGGAIRAVPGAMKEAVLPELASIALHGTPRRIAAGMAAIQATPSIIRGGARAAANEPWLPPGLFSNGPDTPPQRGLLNAGAIITEPPADTSFVRGASAMAHPPNPARALPAAPRVIVTSPPPDASYVRGVPAEPIRSVPPSVRGLLGPAPKPALVTPPPADTSFVRGIPAEYPTKEPMPIDPPRGGVPDSPDMSDILRQSIDAIKARKNGSAPPPDETSALPLKVRRRK